MGVARELPPIPQVFQGSNGRRHHRVRCIAVGCRNGEVLDISASGARVSWRGKIRSQIGEVMELEIDGVEKPFTVSGRIKWLTQLGWRRYEIGVEFVELSEEIKKELVEIAKVTSRW